MIAMKANIGQFCVVSGSGFFPRDIPNRKKTASLHIGGETPCWKPRGWLQEERRKPVTAEDSTAERGHVGCVARAGELDQQIPGYVWMVGQASV